jgi:hypothetical protein
MGSVRLIHMKEVRGSLCSMTEGYFCLWWKVVTIEIPILDHALEILCHWRSDLRLLRLLDLTNLKGERGRQSECVSHERGELST